MSLTVDWQKLLSLWTTSLLKLVDCYTAKLKNRYTARLVDCFTANLENRYTARLVDRFTTKLELEDRFTATLVRRFTAKLEDCFTTKLMVCITASPLSLRTASLLGLLHR